MTYNDLKEFMRLFHRGEISKTEMGFAIGLWQLDPSNCNSGSGNVKNCKEGHNGFIR